MGWLNRRTFAYDALSMHATAGEWQAIRTGQKAPLFMLGLTMALLAHIPFVGLLVPALAALSFVHYGLEALRVHAVGPLSPLRGTGMSRTFGAIIIGDEILSGKRQDKHFRQDRRTARRASAPELGRVSRRRPRTPGRHLQADDGCRRRGVFLRRHRQYAG
jgi:hypothetical protein